MGPGALHHKILRIRNLQKMNTDCIKLMSILLSVTFPSLKKRTTLPQNLNSCRIGLCWGCRVITLWIRSVVS